MELLVCPICKGPFERQRSESRDELICHADGLAFPIREGIPVMLENQVPVSFVETDVGLGVKK